MLTLVSCLKKATNNPPAQEDFSFTETEKSLILSDSANAPMYIFQTNVYEDSIFLRQISRNVDIKDEDTLVLQHLISRMRVTLAHSGGVGIAAPQVGIGRNVFLLKRYDKPGKPIEPCINPEVLWADTSMCWFSGDGCLSVPMESMKTWRHKRIFAGFYDKNIQYLQDTIKGYTGFNNNFSAIIFQHEYDHLFGILYIDRTEQQ